MKKISIAVILIVLGMGAIVVYAQEYIWTPKKDAYTLFYTSKPVLVYFLPYDKYQEEVQRWWGRKDSRVAGFTLHFSDRWEIYMPYERDGSIDLETFGHEIAHVLDYKWHKDYK